MSQDKKAARTYCALAWVHSFVNIGGEYQVCCTSEEFDNDITDKNGRAFNITDDVTQAEVMNAPFMKKLRKMMLKGEWHSLCQRCKVDEELGGVSRRMIENGRYQNVKDHLIQQTAKGGSIDAKILSSDYRLGNLCNLQCRMCGPRSSDRWLADANQLKPWYEQIDENLAHEYSTYDWINQPLLLQEFEAKAGSLQHLHFAGGEPLINPQMRLLLKKCIELDAARNIELTYNTNVTKLPPEVIELWSHFKEVRLLCSVDAFGALNDYIRHGSRWAVIQKNLKYLDENCEALHISEILLSTTVQAYNILYLDELVDFLATEFTKIIPFPNLINLLSPIYLRSQVLPMPIKQKATERLRLARAKIASRIPAELSYLLENAEQAINFMFDEDLSHLYGEFLAFNQRFDEKKKGPSVRFAPIFQWKYKYEQSDN